MHVALNGWFWGQTNTGSGQYIRRLVTYLPKVAPELQLSLVMPPHHPEPEGVPEGVQIVRTGKSGKAGKMSKVLFEQRGFPRALKKIKADLAHVPYWGSPLSSPIPVVVSVLDVIPLIYPVYADSLLNRLYVSLVSSSARGADHIITLSENSKIDIEAYLGIPESKISAIYLAPDERFNPRMGAEKDEAVREKYNLPDQFVFYIGGFDVRKRVNDLILAYTYVAQAEDIQLPLVLGGAQPDWSKDLFPDIPTYIERLGLQEVVQWAGPIDEADLPSVYRMASVFVYPSEYEGFGLPPLEAMASGTPVVTLDPLVFDEILEGGAYITENPRGMAGAILAVANQDAIRDSLVNAGAAQVSKFRWRKTAQETYQVYKYVLGE